MKNNNITNMRGFIEVKEDTYEDTIEHLHRLKTIACKLIKKLSEHSDLYNSDDLETRSHEAEEAEYENEWSLHKRRMPSRYKY